MTDRPAASLPAGSAPEADFFLARTEEQRRFRELLRSQVESPWRQNFPTLARWLPDRREPDPHPNSPWIFLFHGEGGMGKSTLIRRLMAIAEGKLRDKNPGDRAWVDRFTILKIDWETERTNRPSLQGPRDQIAARAVLDVVFDCAAKIDRKVFSDYEQRLKNLEDANEKVSKKLQEEQQGGNPDWSKALASLAKGALSLANRSDFAKDYEGQIDTLAEVTTKVLPQVKTWLQTQLKREELEVFERPAQVLAAALGKGLGKLAAQRPVLMFLDTYEVVDRPECDAIVRLVMQAAGGRVSWVVSGRSNLRNSGKRGEIYFKGYGDDFPEAKLYAKALDEFGEAEIREYFARKVPDHPIDDEDADAQAIREFSLGIPFMVAEIASIWRDRPNLTLKQILAPAPADATKTPRDRAIAAMTERFLVHCLQAGDGAAALGQDLAAIYSLAMVRRPDRSLLAAMLQTEDLSVALENLQTRYSFVFADDCRLHDNLLNYLQPYLRMAAQRERPTVQALNDRALAHLGDRLAAKAEELPDLADRFESKNAKDLWLDVAHHHFWKAQDPDRDEIAAWKFWLGAFVEGWLADRAFARELVQVLGQFERCLSADGRRRYECFKGDWNKRRDFDCDRRRALLDELDKLARRGWLATDNHPERAATLELERARLLYGQKQYVAALQALEALDRRHPDPSNSLREEIANFYNDLASRFLWTEGKTFAAPSPEGLRAAERACTLQPDRAWYLYNWAVALAEAKRHEEAVEIHQRAINLNPSAVRYNGLGNTYRDLKRYEDAIAAYQRAIELDPNFVSSHNNLGNVYRDLKRYEDAIAAYQRAIELDLNYAAPHNNLGNTYRDLKRYEEAIAAYQRAIELDSNESAYHNNLGNAYRDLKRYEEAIAAFQRAIELDPNDAAPHNGLGNTYYGLKRYEEAIAAYQRAIGLDPNYALPHNGLGLAYRDLKRYEEAIAAYQRAIKLDPNFVYAHSNLGLALENLQRYSEAEVAYRQALSIEERAFDFRNLGDVLKAQERYEESIEAYQRAIELDPQNTSPYYDLGLLQFEQGDIAGAIATFQKVAELDPSDEISPNNLGFLCLISDRLDEASAYLLKARELKPDFYMPVFNLAAVRALQSDLEQARSLLAESLQLCPNSGDQEKLHWSILSILLGNVEAGFEQLTQTLASLPNPNKMWPIRGGVLEASQAIARSPLQTPDLHRAIDLLQSHLTP